ncbi:MAG: DUF1592 domain-containing protein [Planctomycetaceae bacterium]
MPARTLLLLIVSVGFASVVNAQEPMEDFLKKHCLRCHGPDSEEGELRIDLLSRDFKSGTDSHLWAEVIERINAGEMPPEDEPQPTQEEISAFVAKLDARIKEGKAARMAARPPVAHYRLSRKEYENTVYDLLGVRYDSTAPGELNEDQLWHGYERIGSQLSLSVSHVDRYYRAAQTVLNRAFPAEPLKTQTVRKTAAEIRYRGRKEQQGWLDRLGIKRPLRCLINPGLPFRQETRHTALSPDWFGRGDRPQSGLYRMRLQASGLRPPGGQVPHLRLGTLQDDKSSGVLDSVLELDVTAPEDNPEIYEAEVFLEMPVSLRFDVVSTTGINGESRGGRFNRAVGLASDYIFTHTSETRLLNLNAPQMFDDEGNALFPIVIVDWIEWEGPLESDAERSLREGVLPPADATDAVVAEHLQQFAERAWRRAVDPDELQGYLTAYQAQREAGKAVPEAFRAAMLGVLTSRHFIYLVEGDFEPRDRLTQSELASRLSYFLWSSMPDDDLLAAAGAGELSGEGLEQEVDRLVTDQRINRFLEDFPRQWLQLHRLGVFTPNKGLYPGYDDWLEKSLREEPIEFFGEMFTNNLPVDDFLYSDWTIANHRISDFYGIAEPKGSGFERVALKPGDNRGGLLTMGAILGMTSDGTRHRPVDRGVWVSEAILNKTPPPPPANVNPIEPIPPEGEKVTIRQRIEVHATSANCAACHRNIDPLGLAFEQFDAIGQWRTRERIPTGRGEDPLVDASGMMPDGRSFRDANEFKQLLLEDRDVFLRAFIEHLSTYALRRVLTIDDADDIDLIVQESKKNQYGVRDIVRAVALSELMQKR